MKNVTADSIRSIIESNMENTDRTDRILAAIRNHNGKLLSKPVAKKIADAAGEESFNIVRRYGMTHLEFGGYNVTNNPDRGISLLIAHTESGVFLDADEIEEKNTCYFSAAKERNEGRRKALDTPDDIDKMVEAINDMNAAWSVFVELTEYGKPLNVDMCSLDKLINQNLRNLRD